MCVPFKKLSMTFTANGKRQTPNGKRQTANFSRHSSALCTVESKCRVGWIKATIIFRANCTKNRSFLSSTKEIWTSRPQIDMKAFCLFVFTSNHCSDLFSHSGLMCLLGTNWRLFSVTRATALRRPRYHFVFILCLFSPLSGARTSEVPNYGEL